MTNLWSLVILSSLLISNVVSIVTPDNPPPPPLPSSSKAPLVPCFFVFGDSLAEPGNNNDLKTMAKANYTPYGVDFPNNEPTGRFTNGFTFVDFLTKLLGFNHLIPPYDNVLLTLEEMKDGVNYASGAAGILDQTGSALGAIIPLRAQLNNHRKVVERLSSKNPARLNMCLYALNIGSNDYINNYFKPDFYNTSEKYTPEQYAKYLIDQYAGYIRDLHDLGARKFAIYGLGFIGCTLDAVATYGADASGCVDKINYAVVLFNGGLVPLIDQLNVQYTDSRFTYINTTSIGPPVTDFKVLTESCCKTRSDGQCQQGTIPCTNRSDYYFYDLIHPTERVNNYTAETAFNAKQPTDARPCDIHKLISGC